MQSKDSKSRRRRRRLAPAAGCKTLLTLEQKSCEKILYILYRNGRQKIHTCVIDITFHVQSATGNNRNLSRSESTMKSASVPLGKEVQKSTVSMRIRIDLIMNRIYTSTCICICMPSVKCCILQLYMYACARIN